MDKKTQRQMVMGIGLIAIILIGGSVTGAINIPGLNFDFTPAQLPDNYQSVVNSAAGDVGIGTLVNYMDGSSNKPLTIIDVNQEKAVKNVVLDFYFTPKINDGAYTGSLDVATQFTPTMAIQIGSKILHVDYASDSASFTMKNGQTIRLKTLTVPVDKSLGSDSVEQLAVAGGIADNANLSLLFSGVLAVTTEKDVTYPISFKDMRVNINMIYTPLTEEAWKVGTLSGNVGIGDAGGGIDSLGGGGVTSGTIVAVTHPVNAKIFLDGKLIGVGGVAVAKPVGTYTLSFEDNVVTAGLYDGGFPTIKWKAPSPQTVTVGAGEVKTVEVTYTINTVNDGYPGQVTTIGHGITVSAKPTSWGDTGATYEQCYGSVALSLFYNVFTVPSKSTVMFGRTQPVLYIQMPDKSIISEPHGANIQVASTSAPGDYGGVIHQGWAMPLQGTYSMWDQDGNVVSHIVTFQSSR